MSPSRSLIAAGSLTALVLVAVLVVGARQGAFGLGSNDAVAALSIDTPALTQDAAISDPQIQDGQAVRHDDDARGHDDDDDDDDEHDEHNGRVVHPAGGGSHSDDRAARRSHDDDD